jgi:predicted small secreted protein
LKKKTKLLVITFLLIFSLLLTACGTKEKTTGGALENSQNENTSTDEEASYGVAESIKDIIKEKPGKYAGTKYNKAIIHKTLNENSFQDKDSFQIYSALLGLVSEGKNYKPHYEYYQNFNTDIETEISKMPGGMKVNKNGEVSLNTNISILLDASGSMAQQIGGKTKMDLAKAAINTFVASMPEGANVSLRVYGQKGSNSDGDKELSCGSSELVYDLKPYNEADFANALGSFQPTGWTPIANAINEAKKDFAKADKAGENILYIVSDGVETCDGDPVKAAKSLHDSNISAVVNIIGFDVDSAGQKQLLSIAEAGGGEFETVETAEDFNKIWEEERQRLWNEWWDWSSSNWNNVWDEQHAKKNDLYDIKTEFGNLAYDEKSRLSEAAYYLEDTEQISYDTRVEVDSLIDQRYDIIENYKDDFYEEIKDEFDANAENLKTAIKKKGEEMKAKYKD